MAKKALIFGITGQDGSYLAELLVSKGYAVHGVIRRSSLFNLSRLSHIEDKLELHYGDLLDGSATARLIAKVNPDEIYNLAAQSHVKVSFEIPEFTANVTALGALRILEAIRETGVETRFYQASSSEMFGNAPAPQSEYTPFVPESPYAAAKCFAHEIVRQYRDGYGLFAVGGILFNHESPRRGETFVTRKVCRAAAQIFRCKETVLPIGNMEASRDWGHAKEYVEAMWLMLQQETPQDFVIGTGVTHSVCDLCEAAFEYVGLNYKNHVIEDPKYFRPNEVYNLQADIAKAKKILGWEPKITFEQLVHEMVQAELDAI